MRFIVKNATLGNERLGILTGFAKSPHTVIETPAFALPTQGGSVVHLTAEVLSKVFTNPQLLWMPLSNSIQLKNGIKAQGQGVAKFSGLPEHIFCVALNNTNAATPTGHLEADSVPLWTKQGKKMIGADRYMDVMEIFKPDLIMAVADSNIALNDGNKRICKSVDRTCSMFDKCVERFKESKEFENSSLIGVIVGAADERKCEYCIERILVHKDSITGVALSGLTDGSEASYNVPVESLDMVFKRVGAILPKDLVKLVEGCWNPAVIISAIEHGWDVFDGSYALKLTNSGRALVMNYDIYQCSKDFCILDLNDHRYKEDFRPILEDCECLTCRKHKRAYIRHLLNTREMLATVLLSIHNLHHFDQLFLHARQHIAANSFSKFKDLVIKQYERYITSYTIGEESEEIDELKKKDTPVKKKRVSNGHNVIPIKVMDNTCS